MDDESVFLGIDFGTSKCVMSWYNPNSGQAEIIRNSNDREETPSLIYFGTSKKDILVGQDAVDKLENTVDFSNCQFVYVKRNIKENFDADLDDDITYTPEDLGKELFLKLKRDAEQFFAKKFNFDNQPIIITRVVITYPELFDAPQQDKITNAAKAAGFTEVKLISEPTAAVIAYCSTVRNPGQRFLVYDLGAGTANIAVIERRGDVFSPPIGQPGELSNCGGDKLDQVLYEYCEKLALCDYGRPISFRLKEVDPRFLHSCRKRKEDLWSYPQPFVEFSSALLDQDGKQRKFYKFTLDRKAYENDIKPEINKTITLTKKILDQTRSRGSSLVTFLVIGGTSRVPLVTDLLNEIDVRPAPWKQPWDRDFAVALGAAYYGKKLWGVPRIQELLAPTQPSSLQLYPPQMEENSVPSSPPPTQFGSHPLPRRTNRQQPLPPYPQTEENSVPSSPPPAQFGSHPLPRRTNRQQPTSLATFVPVLLFGALAVAQYTQGKDIFVTIPPWITSPYSFHWPVTVALALVSLLLFNRSGWGMFLTVAFFVACLAMTILISLGHFLLTIPFVTWVSPGPYMPWWVCGLLALDLFGMILLKLERK